MLECEVVHGLDSLRGIGLMGHDGRVPSLMSEVLHPFDIQLYECRATPLSGFEDDEAYGFAFEAHFFEHFEYNALRIVEYEWAYYGIFLECDIVECGESEGRVFRCPADAYHRFHVVFVFVVVFPSEVVDDVVLDVSPAYDSLEFPVFEALPWHELSANWKVLDFHQCALAGASLTRIGVEVVEYDAISALVFNDEGLDGVHRVGFLFMWT